VWQRRHAGEQLGHDGLPGHEQLDGLDACGRGRGDEVLALADEQSRLLAMLSLRELADELELRVVARRDHPSHSSHWP
jgi:hypothetical protein